MQNCKLHKCAAKGFPLGGSCRAATDEGAMDRKFPGVAPSVALRASLRSVALCTPPAGGVIRPPGTFPPRGRQKGMAILAPPPRTEPTPPGLKGEGLTTGPPSKFLSFSLSGVESSPAGDLQSPILSFVPKTSWQTERRKEVQITQCGSQRGRPA